MRNNHPMDAIDETIEAAAARVAEADRIVVLTGAGISAASGIPTYRDDRGNWLRAAPIQHQAFLTEPDLETLVSQFRVEQQTGFGFLARKLGVGVQVPVDPQKLLEVLVEPAGNGVSAPIGERCPDLASGRRRGG